MGDWPPLAVLIVTYQRRDICLETIRRLKQHLHYIGPTFYVISDDGSTDGTQEAVLANFPDSAIVQNNRVGLGAITNSGLRHCWTHSPYVLQMQDDLHLQGTLDLHPHLQNLIDDETCGFIRLWGVGGHRYRATLQGNYWHIDWESDELFIPSDRPHVKHKRFHDWMGMYPEGLTTGATEQAWCHQCKDTARHLTAPMHVCVPQRLDTEGTFEHVGWHQRWRDVGL